MRQTFLVSMMVLAACKSAPDVVADVTPPSVPQEDFVVVTQSLTQVDIKYTGTVAAGSDPVTVEKATSSTNRGSGQCQRMGRPSLYQGKMPRRYACTSRSGDRSPPTAMMPSSSVSSIAGKRVGSGPRKCMRPGGRYFEAFSLMSPLLSSSSA